LIYKQTLFGKYTADNLHIKLKSVNVYYYIELLVKIYSVQTGCIKYINACNETLLLH